MSGDCTPAAARPASPEGPATAIVLVREQVTTAGLVRLSRELVGALGRQATAITVDFAAAGPVPAYVVGLLNRVAAVLALRRGRLVVRGLSRPEATTMRAGGLDSRIEVQVRSE